MPTAAAPPVNTAMPIVTPPPPAANAPPPLLRGFLFYQNLLGFTIIYKYGNF